ncbi:ZIP family metal transporter [Neptunicella marina]|uniref:Divalent cation transporter n=1 Tax=Neptunicella marina TaxID=2125989 RepID=A0A8J6M2A3_9ALTE|nr:divalent cation transporter [Neptunicella marina]MBC3766027.1 divalent cation transporter [Neptunicella marina]
MHPLILVVLLTLAAGLAMPLGAWVASFEHIRSQWLEQEFRHSVIAFGGGALLSAVALVLVPEGTEHLNAGVAAVCLMAGGILFMGLDILLDKMHTSASQLAAMLSDFIPESMALGAAIAMGNDSAYLLAALIGLQNLPEGFNAYREVKQRNHISGAKIIGIFIGMSLFGPLAGAAGYMWLSDLPVITGIIMLVAAGGILYSVFEDIAPQAKLESHRAPAMGAVGGFVLGVIGYMLV